MAKRWRLGAAGCHQAEKDAVSQPTCKTRFLAPLLHIHAIGRSLIHLGRKASMRTQVGVVEGNLTCEQTPVSSVKGSGKPDVKPMGQWLKCSMLWFVVLIMACSLSVWAAEVPQSLVIAVVNPPNFHHEVLFGVMQCLSDHATKARATGGRDVEVDLYLGAAAVVDNAMGTRDILRPFSDHMRVSYPRVLHWRPGMQDSELWTAPAGSAAPLRKPDLCIAISPE
ncbi:hypothetical protein HaLaN_22206 [Haematococcus lacustris]|uniref:Uncharacterized protein n=1 Tax=Haematococcus lacustris TaxID=44745 RepID=A0A6A0A3K0_HAELA|nr:hypothetical protein HaLaN_22206 [Haematococcus lacustris]